MAEILGLLQSCAEMQTLAPMENRIRFYNTATRYLRIPFRHLLTLLAFVHPT
jgi:hypothetical protein